MSMVEKIQKKVRQLGRRLLDEVDSRLPALEQPELAPRRVRARDQRRIRRRG